MRDHAERTSRYIAHGRHSPKGGVGNTQRLGRTSKTALSTLAGLVIRGKQTTYELRKQIGRGAMGSVYLAYHSGGEVPVAVKVLHGELCKRIPTALQRCLRGAGSIGRVQHENIVRVLEFGTTEDGIGFVVMEYVDGTDLDSLLAWKGPLPWQQVARIGVQLGRALAAAHEKGLIHRDVKPANCLFVNDNKRELVKLADFGIAREVRLASEDGITGVNMLVGTPEYLAPESLHTGTLTPRMDIYSLGVTLYKLVTGMLPFQAGSPEEVLKQKMRVVPVPPSEVLRTAGIDNEDWPKHLDTIILRAISRYPQDRFKTASEMVRALENYVLMRATVPFDELPTQSLSHREKTEPSIPPRVADSGFRFGFGQSSGTEVFPKPESTSEFESDEPDCRLEERGPESFPWLLLGLHSAVLVTFVAIVVLVLVWVGLPEVPTQLPAVIDASGQKDSPKSPLGTKDTLEATTTGNKPDLPRARKTEEIPKQARPPSPPLQSPKAPVGAHPSGPETPPIGNPGEALEPKTSGETSPSTPDRNQQAKSAAAKRLRQLRPRIKKACRSSDWIVWPENLAHSTIQISVKVGSSGQVESVKLRGNKIESRPWLTSCIREQVVGTVFEQSRAKYTVKTKVTF